MKVKNVHPYGDQYVPAAGVRVAAGEVADLPDDVALALLVMPECWEPGDKAAAKAAEGAQAAQIAMLAAAQAEITPVLPADGPTVAEEAAQ